MASLAAGFWVTAAFADPTTDGNSMESDLDITVPVMTELTGVAAQIVDEDYVSGDVDELDTVCVFSNDPTNTRFDVTATCKDSTGAACTAGGFFIDDGTNDMEYTVYFDAAGGGATNDLAVGVAETLTGGSTAKDCGAVDNFEFRVLFTEAEVLAAPAGNYSGTLVINVAPTS